MSNNTSYKDLFTERNYLKLTIANTISRFGDSIVSIAYIWLMYELTGSAALMAINLFMQSIPKTLFQPISGAIVDKLSKKKVLLICMAGRFIAMFSVAFLVMLDLAGVFILLAFTFICSTIEAVYSPAIIAITPLVLAEDKYSTGTGLNNSLGQAANLAGTAIAGVLVVIIGSVGVLALGAATSILSFFFVFTMNDTERRAASRINLRSAKQSIYEGVSYVKANRLFGALLALGMLLSAMVVPFSAFSVVFLMEYLESGPEFFSVVKVSLSVAAMVGAVIMPKMKKTKNKRIILSGGSLIGMCMMLMSFLPLLGTAVLRQGFMILIVAIAGVALGAINVMFGVIFIQQIDKEFLGRMEGITNSATGVAVPVISAICAVFAASADVPRIFFAFGAILVFMFTVLSRFRIYNRI